MHHFSIQPAVRRRTLLHAAAAALAFPAVAGAKTGDAAAPVTVAQLYDRNAGQQDVSKDFVIGSRAAWHAINAQGGIRGRRVEHRTLEADSAAGLEGVLTQVLDDAGCIVLSGSAGDPAASAAVRYLARQSSAIAHVAPWLQDAGLEVDERTFPIFAARQEQIAHALTSISVMGLKEAGVVYASAAEQRMLHEDLVRSARAAGLAMREFTGSADLATLGRGLGPATPALLLFVGGTPELARFTQGLEAQARQRWVVAMADVNMQTLQQMGGARRTPVIVTQAVPMVTASQPVVRAFRETMARLFDEPPTPLALAGYLAARYTYEVLREVDGPLTRASALSAFRKRAGIDLGGFRIAYDARRRSAAYVTQSMLAGDGRVVG